jgi:hypothetical protein
MLCPQVILFGFDNINNRANDNVITTVDIKVLKILPIFTPSHHGTSSKACCGFRGHSTFYASNPSFIFLCVYMILPFLAIYQYPFAIHARKINVGKCVSVVVIVIHSLQKFFLHPVLFFNPIVQ